MSSIFLAHSSKDKRFARRLAKALESKGIRVWIDEAELLPGDSIIGKIERSIKEMTFLGAILSPHSVRSEWVQKEIRTAITEEITSARVKVLPILYKRCEVPLFLTDKVWVDFTSHRRFHERVESLARRLAMSANIGLSDYRPWTSEVVTLGIRFGVLEGSETGVVFADDFLRVFYQNCARELACDTDELRHRFMLSVLDNTPVKILDWDLASFTSIAFTHIVEFLITLALEARIAVFKGGGYAVDAGIRDQLAEFLSNTPPRQEDLRSTVLKIVQDMVQAHLALHAPRHFESWGAVFGLVSFLWGIRGKIEMLNKEMPWDTMHFDSGLK